VPPVADLRPPGTALFAASQRVLALDHFRVPYEVSAELQDERFEQLRVGSAGSVLRWPAGRRQEVTVAACLLAGADDQGIPIFARILPDRLVARLLDEQDWERVRPIVDARGQGLGWVWRRDDGSVFLPFDPNEVVDNYFTERYATVLSGAFLRKLKHSAIRAYYGARPVIPRASQIWLRRRFARIQMRSRFPRWPTESALDDFFELLFAVLSGMVGAPIPRIAAWPDGRTWALVLTHDVEQADGYAAVDRIFELERRYGLRSCWYYVPRRYPIDLEDLRRLKLSGSEVGIHGLYHDGRDLASLATLKKRIPDIRDAAERWGAVGFRAPALHRQWDWMPLLGFDYDTSFPDTDPYEPMPGGCCSWLPFFIGDLVELPVTLPQDHTLFVILRQQDETVWVQKAELLRARGGMALMDSHPDYLLDPRVYGAYERFLERFTPDEAAWRALPREVSAWWRRRAASRLEHDGKDWHIVGPAAVDGRIEFAGGAW
jgi:hypothetical protein